MPPLFNLLYYILYYPQLINHGSVGLFQDNALPAGAMLPTLVPADSSVVIKQLIKQ